MTERLAAALAPLVEGRGKGAPLFEGRYGGRISRSTIRRWLGHVQSAVGLETKGAHVLRHSAATSALAGGADRTLQSSLKFEEAERPKSLNFSFTVALACAPADDAILEPMPAAHASCRLGHGDGEGIVQIVSLDYLARAEHLVSIGRLGRPHVRSGEEAPLPWRDNHSVTGSVGSARGRVGLQLQSEV